MGSIPKCNGQLLELNVSIETRRSGTIMRKEASDDVMSVAVMLRRAMAVRERYYMY